MTHDELLHMAEIFAAPDHDYSDVDLEVELLTFAEGYLALSVKWEEAQAQNKKLLKWQTDAANLIEAQTSAAADLSQGYRVLLGKVEEAERTVSSRDGVLAMTVYRLGGMVEGRPTERVNFLQRIDELVSKEAKLEEAQAENGALRGDLANLENGQRLPASPSEIVEACPQCGAHLIAQGPAGPLQRWVCGTCDARFDEPAYYQRVKVQP